MKPVQAAIQMGIFSRAGVLMSSSCVPAKVFFLGGVPAKVYLQDLGRSARSVLLQKISLPSGAYAHPHKSTTGSATHMIRLHILILGSELFHTSGMARLFALLDH